MRGRVSAIEAGESCEKIEAVGRFEGGDGILAILKGCLKSRRGGRRTRISGSWPNATHEREADISTHHSPNPRPRPTNES